MKKTFTKSILSVAVALFSFGFIANGQSIFSEDFQGGMPATWTLIDVDGLNPNYAFMTDAWVSFENPDQAGDSVAASTSWYVPAGVSNDWMISPAISLTSNNTLTWDEQATDVNYLDGYELRISTTTPTITAFYSNPVLYSTAAASNTWISRSVDLQAMGYSNQTVYLAWVNNSDDKNLLLIDDIAITGPVNPIDECINAQQIAVNDLGICSPTTGTVENATVSLPACAGTAGTDVWYRFTATNATQLILVQGNGDFDAVMEVFTGTCGALTSLGCIDGTLEGEAELAEGTGLTVGATYYVRVFDYWGTNVDQSFTICVRTPCDLTLPAGIAEIETCGDSINDGCNATPVPAYQTISVGQTITGQAYADEGSRDTDWYEFTVTAAGDYTMTGSAEFPFALILADHSDCNAPIVLESVGGNPCTTQSITATLTPGTYVAFIAPDDFNYYVCSLTYSDYWFDLTGGPVSNGCDTTATTLINLNQAGGAPCFDGNSCIPVDAGWTTFGTWGSESYLLDDVQAGYDYVFDICTGFGAGSWIPEIRIVAPDGTTIDATNEQPATGSTATHGTQCSLSWTASQSGTYTIMVNEMGTNAGDAPNQVDCLTQYQVDNGNPTVSCGPNPAPCIAPCDLTLPPGCTAEVEACGDSINDGCNLVGIPAQYQPIACDETICGTVEAEGGERDTDWYLFSVPATTDVTLTGSAEFPFAILIVDITDCNNPLVLNDVVGDDCEVQSVTQNLTPGAYVAFFSSTVYEGYPCSSDHKDYWMTLTMALGTPTALFNATETQLSVAFNDLSINADSWFWDFGDGSTSIMQNPTHVYAAAGTYTACLIASMDCGGSDTICMTVTPDITIGVVESGLNSLSFYPNPTNGTFTLEIAGEETVGQISILDFEGRSVYEEPVYIGSNFRKTIDADLSSGTYILRVTTENDVITSKLSVK